MTRDTALASITPDQTRLRNTPDASANRPRGSEFNRRKGVNFQPALTRTLMGWYLAHPDTDTPSYDSDQFNRLALELVGIATAFRHIQLL